MLSGEKINLNIRSNTDHVDKMFSKQRMCWLFENLTSKPMFIWTLESNGNNNKKKKDKEVIESH